MKLPEIFSSVSERAYIFAFAAIIVVCSVYTYSQLRETFDVDKKIASRQQDLARTVTLKDMYLAKRKDKQDITPKSAEEKTTSLGMVEELTSKTFRVGRLNSLRPTTSREERGKAQLVYELKVGGATLGEVIAFVKEVESSHLYIKKLQLNMTSSVPAFIDMYAIITAG